MNKNVYQRKDGRFEARVSLGKDENGKRRYRSFYGNTRAEAEYKMLAALEPQDDMYALTEMTVTEIAFEYIKIIKPRLKESTEANYRMKLENHIIPAFGTIKCCMLRANEVYGFIEEKLKEGLSARYIADIVVLLKSIYRYASRTYNVKNVLEGLVMPKCVKAEVEVLSKLQQQQLLNYLNETPDLTALGITLALYTGMRIGELCALQWKDIDLRNHTISVNKTIQRIQTRGGKNKTELVITEPKSSSSIRVIPIPGCLATMLEKFSASGEKYVLSGKVKPIEPRTIQYRFATKLEKAKLPSVHYHSLRHAFASNCIALGFDVKTLSEILGHNSVEITLNRYVHSSLDRKKAYMDMLKFAA